MSLQAKRDEIIKIIEGNKIKIVTYERHIVKHKKKLDEIKKKSAVVKSEKEIMALSQEELLAKDNIKFDNDEINRLNKMNEIKLQELEEIEKELEEAKKELERVKAEVEKELKEIEEKKIELINKRERIARNMERKILSFYEKIKKWAGTTAVVKVEKQACFGCYLKINDKAYSDLISGDDIVTCPHCGRILYVEFLNEKEEATS